MYANVSKRAVISEHEDIGEQSFSAILSGFRSAQVGLSMENKSHYSLIWVRLL